MPRTITLTNLRLRVREDSDTIDDPNVTDTELDAKINYSIAKLRNILTLAFGADYFGEKNNFTAVSGQESYDTTSASVITSQNLLFIRGIDVLESGTGSLATDKWKKVERYNFAERCDNYPYSKSSVRYRFRYKYIDLLPAPNNSSDIFRVHYIPYAPLLSNPSDTFDGYNGWEEWCIKDAAIQICNKQETNTQPLIIERKLIEQTVSEMAQFRDLSPQKMVDVFKYFDSSISREDWENLGYK